MEILFIQKFINNFKSFNDKYGYVRGDAVIMQTARIISMAVKNFGTKSDFVGHIGGDDFVAVVNPENEKIRKNEENENKMKKMEKIREELEKNNEKLVKNENQRIRR